MEIAADAVVVLESEERPQLAAVVEVQLRPDEEKRRAWPTYIALLHRELACPCVLLVIALDEGVARWCARPIELGHPRFVLEPLVVGREAVPRITDEERAAEDVELAVLSAVAHSSEANALEVALPAVRAMDRLAALDAERSAVYFDLVHAALPAAVRSALEAVMSSKYEYQSDFARRYFAEGKAEGEARGRTEGEANALLRVLAARGFAVDAETERRVRTCRDLQVLERWVTRAVTVSSLSEVFDDG